MRSLKTRKNILFPATVGIPVPAIKEFLTDFGRVLLQHLKNVYEDLQALQNADLVDTLPTAAATLRGRLFILNNGTGVADSLHICIKNAADSYEFLEVTLT